ncbi:glycoside hydrolase family 3 N-terminal domain-containing protein [Micromonospora sp. WMMD1155]|uniref:glycoside hydrolase family 3 N-terminal domain-containing protein n=1 Tax=Micromonospora sp. WMMD1155 TaxID=3016094 RepID=UPI00249C70E5|nr:glycoside hydrolase family 3 N-terminal domain-containing protein [Micromonospora sp. WMMD1155]WFE53443.1 glycoside hydrolase family 3 N-terminal domain-containing protein [Micromonospora sp. WMMD1155]
MTTVQPETGATYADATAPVSERVSDLLARMTREEKIAQLGSTWAFAVLEGGRFSVRRARPILGHGLGHVTRVAGATSLKAAQVARVANAIQRYLVTETRLGIPAIVHEEVCSGVMARDATIFPQAIGVASTWAPELNGQLADAVRAQMRAMGGHQGLSPVLDVVRDPRWGRTEETYGEDPYLVSRMGVAFVRGLQGVDLTDGVIATAKHFVGYGASEGGLNWAPAHLPPRLLREVYLYPFEAAVREGGLRSVMAGYHELDGIPCHANDDLLADVLRRQWGFTGSVVSDYFAVNDLHSYHHFAQDKQQAATLALGAGVDVELPATDVYAVALTRALDAGDVSEARLDEAVARVLRHKFELGLFEAPYVDEDAVAVAVNAQRHRTVALEIARRSLVLLKNDGVLPLLAEAGSVALIGPNADDARHLLGDYSFAAHIEALTEARERRGLLGEMMTIPDDLEIEESTDGVPTVRDELTARLGDRVRYASGCDVLDPSTDGFDEAVAVAAAADVAVLVLGDRSGLTPRATTGESRDRSSLDLPGVQEDLVRAVVATGTPVVVVLVAGRPVGSDFLHEHAAAVLMAWLPGETGAQAIAEVLLGEVNPSGRLPISYPRSVGQLPVFYGHKVSGGRSHWHGDYVDSPVTPRYCFGHGLGYSSFIVEEATVRHPQVRAGDSVGVDVVVTNAGRRAGEEVVQLYVRDPQASVTRPVLELKGFVRVSAAAGQRVAVRFDLPTGQLGFYDRRLDYTVEPGQIEVYVGFSAQDRTLAGRFVISADADRSPTPKVFTGTAEVRGLPDRPGESGECDR